MFKIRFFPLSVSWSAFFCLPLHTVQRNTLYVRVLKLIFLFHSLCIAFFVWHGINVLSSCLYSFDCRMNFSRWLTLRRCCTTPRTFGQSVKMSAFEMHKARELLGVYSIHSCWWHSVCSALQCTNDIFYDELALVLLSVASTGFLFYFFYVFISLSNHSRSLCVCFCLV